ncbi:tetratricopeptide repeat protein [Verrucomicrobium sp. BvORR106]|uniref:tetratricopeptide repeat protein n=1 Tax=Verrucomicrobium sp. BvORR106 TaxID=1403819 RepID=UPI0009DE01F1|nr:tetratricopeptide repeat protein [Verrucomicrobium sp. BvORR106]
MKTRAPRIFVSAVSADLRSTKMAVAKTLRRMDCLPKVHDEFPLEHGPVPEVLRRTIKDCDAVIHIAGLRYGFEPSRREDGESRRSYTQMEVDLARKLKKPLYLFLCDEAYPYDPPRPVDPEREEEVLQELQKRHRLAVERDGKSREKVTSYLQLENHVLTLGPKLEKLRDRHGWVRWAVCLLLVLAVALGLYQQHLAREGQVLSGAYATDLASLAYDVSERMAGLACENDPVGGEDLLEKALDELTQEHNEPPGKLRKKLDVWAQRVATSWRADPCELVIRDYLTGQYASVTSRGVKLVESLKAEANRATYFSTKKQDQLLRPLLVTGDALFSVGDLGKAKQFYEDALKLADREAEPGRWARIVNRLVAVTQWMGKWDEAENWQRSVVALLKVGKGNNSTELAEQCANLAEVLSARLSRERRNALTEQEIESLLQEAERMIVANERHPLVRASDLLKIAKVRIGLRTESSQRSKAKRLLETALVDVDGHMLARYALKATVRLELGGLEADDNHVDRALQLLTDAADLFRQAGRNYELGVIMALQRQAGLLESLGRNEEAGKLYETCLAQADAHLGKTSYMGVQARIQIGSYFLRKGQTQLALKFAEHAVEICRDQGHLQGNWVLVDALHQLGNVLEAMGRDDAAMKHFEEALEVIARGEGMVGATGYYEICTAQFLERKGRYEEAERRYKAAVEDQTTLKGADHEDVLNAELCLSVFLGGQNRPEEAEGIVRRVLNVQELRFGRDSLVLIYTLTDLSRILQHRGLNNEARMGLDRVLSLAEKHYGKANVALLPQLEETAEFCQVTGDWLALERTCRRALELLDPAPVARDYVVSWTSRLGYARYQRNGWVEAELYARQALLRAADVSGQDSQSAAIPKVLLAISLARQDRLRESATLAKAAAAILDRPTALMDSVWGGGVEQVAWALDGSREQSCSTELFGKVFEWSLKGWNAMEERPAGNYRSQYLASLKRGGMSDSEAEEKTRQVEAEALATAGRQVSR